MRTTKPSVFERPRCLIIGPTELREFGAKFEAALRHGGSAQEG
jgi:hypothetical protein